MEQNIKSILETVEPDAHTRNIMLEELLVEFDISHLRTANAMTLSGGERRRVEIAARWRHGLRFFCWMNRLPALTRLQFLKFVT